MSALKPPYPCPDCVGTVIPGETVTFPRHRGAGKTVVNPSWNWPSGSFYPGATMPPDEYVKCRRCNGTGLVADRRIADQERRRPLGDRSGWLVEVRWRADNGAPFVHVELWSRGTKTATDTGAEAELQAVIGLLADAGNKAWPNDHSINRQAEH